MITFLSILCAAALFVAVALGVKVYAMKKSARELADCFSFALGNDTNAGIALSSRDKDMTALASTLDGGLRELRAAFLTYDSGNAELKKAIADISHDLRTPLTAIGGYLELLEKEKKSKTVERYLDIVGDRVDVMKSLTEELFDYSFSTSYGGEAATDTDVNCELETALLDFYTAFEKKNIEPRVVLPQERIVRTVDRSKLQRILSNIINNAVKYASVDFSAELTADGTIIFSNTADDLDPVGAARLFDRYYTVNSGARSGGLGLAIARELAEDVGGSLSGSYSGGKLYIRLKL